jgi:hypothetical protein
MSQIIACKTTVGTLFPIIKKYSSTIIIAQSFIRHCIKETLERKGPDKLSIFVRYVDSRAKKQA